MSELLLTYALGNWLMKVALELFSVNMSRLNGTLSTMVLLRRRSSLVIMGRSILLPIYSDQLMPEMISVSSSGV